MSDERTAPTTAPPATVIDVGYRMPAAPPFDAMRAAIAAEAVRGAASFWWPDHLLSFHVPELWDEQRPAIDELHRYLDPFVCMQACADAAGSALIGVSVTDGIRRMPATLAQAALSLDHLAPGRVVLGLGAGEAANYVPFGWSVESPADRLATAAAAIRTHFDGPGPDDAGAVMGLRPDPSSRGPQLWIGAHGPRGLAVTGRYADGWLPYLLDVEEWHAARDAVRSAAVDAGRSPEAITTGLQVNAVIAPDHATANALLDHPAVRALALLFPVRWYRAGGWEHPLGRSGLHSLIATRLGPALRRAADAVPAALVHQRIPHGTPDEIAAHVRRHRGVQHVRLADYSLVAGTVDPEESRELRAETARLLRSDAA